MPETSSGHYGKFVALDPDSLKMDRLHPTQSEQLENEKFADYQFWQLFTYLKPDQYNEILKIAERS